MKKSYLFAFSLVTMLAQQPAHLAAVEYSPYIEVGSGIFQLDMNVDTFGQSSSNLPGGFIAGGLHMDWETDFNLGLQLRASGSGTGDASISKVPVASRIKFPLYSLFIIPQYIINEDWSALAILGASSSPTYSLTYTSGVTVATQSKTQFSYGVGARYKLSRDLHLGMEWIKFQSNTGVTPSTVTPVTASISGAALTFIYQFSDEHKHPAPVIKYVEVAAEPVPDVVKPELHVLGGTAIQHVYGQPYVDAGASAIDNQGGDISAQVKLSAQVDIYATGYYTLQYDVADAAGNAANPVWRTVQVVIDPLIKEMVATKHVIFPSNSSYAIPESDAQLDALISLMKTNPAINVEIMGHADSLEDDRYNLWLSQRRADAVLRYMAGRGIDDSRLSTSIYGESRPKSDNISSNGRATNRRVEFRMTNEAEINAGKVQPFPDMTKQHLAHLPS